MFEEDLCLEYEKFLRKFQMKYFYDKSINEGVYESTRVAMKYLLISYLHFMLLRDSLESFIKNTIYDNLAEQEQIYLNDTKAAISLICRYLDEIISPIADGIKDD